MLRALLALLCLLASPALARCPAPSDMAKGVSVTTVSPRGEQNVFVFRKTGQGRVDERRVSQWIAASNTVDRELHRGLLPLTQRVIKFPKGSKVLKNEVYDYPGQNIARILIEPEASFTVQAVMTAEDGFSKATTTTYSVGPVESLKFGACRLKVMEITGVEDWDGIETVHTYAYFARLGFAVETRTKYPGKTFKRKIMEIGPAKP